MGKVKEELLFQKEKLAEEQDYFASKLSEIEKELESISDRLAEIRLEEDLLIHREYRLKDEFRSLKQMVERPTKLQEVDKLFAEARKADADWDYDNDKQSRG